MTGASLPDDFGETLARVLEPGHGEAAAGVIEAATLLDDDSLRRFRRSSVAPSESCDSLSPALRRCSQHRRLDPFAPPAQLLIKLLAQPIVSSISVCRSHQRGREPGLDLGGGNVLGMLSGKRKGRPLSKSIALVLALSGAGTVMLLAPVTAGASTRGVASASEQHPVIPPVGRVQATALPLPGPQQSPTESVRSLPFRSMNPEALRAAKRTATETRRAPSGVGIPSLSAAPSAAALVNGLNRLGLSASDESSSVTPPDSTGAIGPTRYVEMVNQLVGVYDRSNLALLSQLALGNFVGAPGGITTSDPQVEWDGQANRWLFGAVGFDSTFLNNYLLFGWSKTGDPSDLTGGWCRYGVFTGSNLQDYPKLGHDANFVTFGSNVFDGSKTGFPFVTANIWAIAKPGAADSTCSSPVSAIYFADATHLLRNADASLASTPVPANTSDAATNDYIVAAHDASVVPAPTNVMVWHMETRPTTPFVALVADGDVPVGSSYSAPPNVPQPGTPYLLDSLDGRLTQAVAHWDPSVGAEAVWTQHTVAGSGRSMVRWYEFLPATLAIRQQGQLASATDFFWNAAISPSSAGSDAAIFYNRGSSSLLPVIGAQTRVSSTPLGQMDAGELFLGSSTNADQETGFSGNCAPNPCRWGDYSGATPDPVNAGVVWGSNQLTGPVFPFFNLAQWTTQNFAISTGTAAVDFSLTATPSSQTVVAGNPATYTVTVTPSSGFTGTVTFSASGLPAGTTGSYNPASVATSGSSTLTVTTASTTPTGSFTVTTTGTSGSLAHTTSVTLVVQAAPTPDFSLSATPSSQTVVQGGSTMYTVTVTPSSGFTGTVTFSASGLPAGTTGSYNPASVATSGSSTLTVTTASTTPTGSFTVTTTGTSGSLAHTTSVTLVVQAAPAGDYSLSANPTSRSIKQGTSTTYTVNITRTSFTGGVTFSVSGLPAGTTATFSPNPGAGASSTLKVVSAGRTTPTGTYVLTITGVSGSLTHTTKVTLVVTRR